MPYLYGETDAPKRRELKAHLGECAECQRLLESWQGTVNRLDAWKPRRVRKRAEWFVPALRWALPAILLVGLGIALGRFTAGGPSAEQVRVRIEPELRAALRQDLAQMVNEEVRRSSAATLNLANEQTKQTLAAYAAVNDARRTQDLEQLYLAIKREVDTLAINTEKSFVQLAASESPPNSSNPQ